MKPLQGTGENPYAAPTIETSEVGANLQRDGDQWTIDFEMIAEDLNAFTLHHYFKTPVARSQYLRHWCTMTVVVMLIGLMVGLTFSILTGIGVFAFGVLYGIGFPWLYRARVKKLSQMLLSGGRNVGMLGAHRVQISPRGLFYRTDAGESLTYWRAVERIDRDQAYAYIYLSSVSAIVVARREFSAAEDFEDFFQRAQSFLDAAVPSAFQAV